jgi:hypothetical protein
MSWGSARSNSVSVSAGERGAVGTGACTSEVRGDHTARDPRFYGSGECSLCCPRDSASAGESAPVIPADVNSGGCSGDQRTVA